MNYAAIKPCDIANGPGVRVSLFVSGCAPAVFSRRRGIFSTAAPLPRILWPIFWSCWPRTMWKV